METKTIRDARPERITTRMFQTRKEHSLTQGDVGRILNINDSLISIYERDIRKPSVNHRPLLEAFFELPLEELLEPVELVTQVRSVQQVGKGKKGKRAKTRS